MVRTSIAKYELRKIAYLNLRSKFIVFPYFLTKTNGVQFEFRRKVHLTLHSKVIVLQ